MLRGSYIFIKHGGTINLTCSIESQLSPDNVQWYHNGTLIETRQTKWALKKRICASEDDENCTIQTSFNLNIKEADEEKSGYYSCAMGDLQPAKVYAEVLNGTWWVSRGNYFVWFAIRHPILIWSADPVIINSTMHGFLQENIVQIAEDALKLHGAHRVSLSILSTWKATTYLPILCFIDYRALLSTWEINATIYLEEMINAIVFWDENRTNTPCLIQSQFYMCIFDWVRFTSLYTNPEIKINAHRQFGNWFDKYYCPDGRLAVENALKTSTTQLIQ